jgi:hypothetical protein
MRYPCSVARRAAFLFALLLTSAAGAQPSVPGSELVDPWRASTRPLPHKMLLDLDDPWTDRASPDLIDPWRPEKKTARLDPRAPEVIDPWRDDPPARAVPTAAFPLVDPWLLPRRGRAKVPTAGFPLVDPWRK